MPVMIEKARLALRRAMEVRKRLGIPMDHVMCVFDIAQQLGVEVWFKPLPSLGGMYRAGDDPVILIGSDRPIGYQTSTCAHEIGHHMFGHGTRVDEYVAGPTRSRSDGHEESLANHFAAHLLMPQAAVTRVFGLRRWSMTAPTPEQVFMAAGYLGVGYQMLVEHLCWTVRSLDRITRKRLLDVSPKMIRASLFGRPIQENVVMVDEHWLDRPIDLVVGDVAMLPASTQVEGRAMEVVDRSQARLVVRAVRRGLGRAEQPTTDWSTYLRVMPKRYDGAAFHRHLEDPDES